MFTFLNDSKKYVYHYTSIDTAVDYILKDETLLVSCYNKTNDPKETKDWFFIPGSNHGRCLDKYTPEYLSKIMNPVIKEATHVICFTKDEVLTGNVDDMARRGFCKPRMWAQYGDKHKGVCLIFDFEELSEAFHERFCEYNYDSNNVTYKDRDIAEIQMDQTYVVNVDALEDFGHIDYARAHAAKFKQRLFFEKASDWSNENEYRWVLFDFDGNLPPKFSFKSSLKGIVFGADCDETMIQKVVKASLKLHLQYQQLRWRNCAPWFNFERTKWV